MDMVQLLPHSEHGFSYSSIADSVLRDEAFFTAIVILCHDAQGSVVCSIRASRKRAACPVLIFRELGIASRTDLLHRGPSKFGKCRHNVTDEPEVKVRLSRFSRNFAVAE